MLSGRKIVGWCVAQAYRFAGARRRALARCAMPGCVLPIVTHAPAPGVFRDVLVALKGMGFRFVSAEDVLAGRAEDGLCAWMSLDDGCREVKALLPVLEEFSAPVAVFISPGETLRRRFWTDGLWNGLLDVDWRTWYDLPADVRYAHVDAAWEGRDDVPRRWLLDESEVRDLAQHPLVTIENHTWSHLSATHRPLVEALDEIDRTQKILTEWTGRIPRLFAYPFGHGIPELDMAICARGLIPIYLRQGLVTAKTFGAARNLMLEDVSCAENIGRILQAWPKVGGTR